MRILIEGPDKCGKTTLVKEMVEIAQEKFEAVHLPRDWYRARLLSGEISGTASTFLFFTETMELWSNPPENCIIDRDILSMIAYQGILKRNMNPMIILNLYKSVVYAANKPDKIGYLVNEPFEDYADDDIFESYGYEAIRAAYEEAVRLVELNFPEIEIERMSL